MPVLLQITVLDFCVRGNDLTHGIFLHINKHKAVTSVNCMHSLQAYLQWKLGDFASFPSVNGSCIVS